MNPIDVSVIIPIYNACEYLDRCIVSLLRQTKKNLELILVDDGSKDHSYEIATSYAKRFPDRVIAITQENGGPSRARNRGLDLARGKYIGFLDADDWADVDLYQKLYRTAKEEEADLVVCGRFDVISDMKTFKALRRTPDTRYSGSSIFEVPQLLSDTTQFIWDKLFRREIIEENHIRFDESFRFTEDVLFLCQYKYFCRSISILPDSLVYHFQTDRDTTAKYGPTILNVPDVLERVFAFYTEKNYFREVAEVFFDLTAKRLLFRVDRFPYMGTKHLQYEFCRRIFCICKAYFPHWKKRLINYNRHGYAGGPTYLYRASFPLMWLYIYLPNPIKQLARKFGQYRKKRKKELEQKKKTRKVRIKRYTDLIKNAYYYHFLTLDSNAIPVSNNAVATTTHKKEKSRIKDSQVLIQSKGGREPAGNMLALLCESLAQDKKVILSITKANIPLWHRLCDRYDIDKEKVRCVTPDSYAFYKALATSKFLYNDSAFPHRFIKQAGQIYVNSWHGVPLKAMGCEVPGRAYAIGDVQRNLLLADYLIYPNPFMQEKMFHAYMLDDLYGGTVIKESYPRVSVLTKKERREEIRKSLGFEGKTISCYLPTWRGLMTQKQNTKQYADCLTFLRQLDRKMDENHILYVKLHPYAQKGFVPGHYKHIRMFPEDYETYDFLAASDVLITDYSSVFFDYAFADFSKSKTKIILFAYDYEEYRKDRGLYIELEDLPFPLVEDVASLYKEMCLPKSYDDEAFKKEFCPYKAADSAKRICNYLYKGENSCQLLPPKDKKRVLFYGELLEPSPAHTKLMQLLQHAQYKKSDCVFYTGILSAAMKTYADRITKLLNQSRFLSVEPDLFYTPLEVIAHKLSIKRGKRPKIFRSVLTRLYQREYRRNFGALHFDAVIFCTMSDERHRRIFEAGNTKIIEFDDGMEYLDSPN